MDQAAIEEKDDLILVTSGTYSIRDVCDAAPGILTAATAPMPRCWNFPNVE